MRVRLISAAEAELAAALVWYEGRGAGLVTRFLDEYERILDRLRDNPLQFPAVHGDLRRAGFRRFPFSLIYRIHPAEVEVISCFHGRRNPIVWQRRGQ